jgi:hypothetical protein
METGCQGSQGSPRTVARSEEEEEKYLRIYDGNNEE